MQNAESIGVIVEHIRNLLSQQKSKDWLSEFFPAIKLKSHLTPAGVLFSSRAGLGIMRNHKFPLARGTRGQKWRKSKSKYLHLQLKTSDIRFDIRK